MGGVTYEWDDTDRHAISCSSSLEIACQSHSLVTHTPRIISKLNLEILFLGYGLRLLQKIITTVTHEVTQAITRNSFNRNRPFPFHGAVTRRISGVGDF